MSRTSIIKDFEEELAIAHHKKALIENEVQTIERMIRKAKGESENVELEPRKRQNVKSIVIGLLQERAGLGLTPQVAVNLASSRGISLEKTTVSSLLSRLKNDNVVQHDGSVYRIARQGAAPNRPDSTDSIFH